MKTYFRFIIAILYIFGLGGLAIAPRSVLAVAVIPGDSSFFRSSTINDVPADGYHLAELTIVARNGDLPVSGAPTYLQNIPSMTGVDFSTALVSTDANGVAKFYVKSTKSGQATFYAVAGGMSLNGSVSINFFNAVSASQSTVTASPTQVPANGSSAITVTVTARDSSGITLPYQTVVLSTNIAGNLSSQTKTTDANGIASFNVVSNTPGTGTSVATIEGVNVNQVPSFTFTSIATPVVSGTASSLTISPSSIEANGQSQAVISVVARDSSYNVLSGKKVILNASDVGSFTYTPNEINTDSNGYAQFTIKGYAPATVTITAFIDNVQVQPSKTITFYSSNSGTTVSPSQSTVGVSPSSLYLNGSSSFYVTVVAKNANGTTLGGKWAQINFNLPYVNVTPLSVYTDVNGWASFDIRPTQIGTGVFTMTVDGVKLNQQSLVTVLPVSSSCSYNIGTLVKLSDDKNPYTQSDSTVYYYGKDCKRHAFPNEKVYFSWFSGFGVTTISASTMANMPLGKNITYRPGARMVKFPSVNKVYMVGKGGVLRWVTSEWLANSYFGSNWGSKIDDVSEAFYSNYYFGSDIVNVWDYNVGNEYSNADISLSWN